MQVEWNNVPPVPTQMAAKSFGLGDPQLAYRTLGVTLQNFGDTGGRMTPLKDYDFESLTDWFYLMDHLDSVSDYVPYLASYYFGSTTEGGKLAPMMDYLLKVGQRPYGEKWRWLAHGVFLARYELQDMDKALEMAEIAAQLDRGPLWLEQLPVFVLDQRGEKEVAYALMLETLKSGVDTLPYYEINARRDYICTRLLGPAEAKESPLCNEDVFH